MRTNRRRFLKNSSAMTLGTLPMIALAGAKAAAANAKLSHGKILVVIQMSGGNDGINTVVPFGDEGYSKHRKELRLPTESLLKVNDTVGLHPSMKAAAKLLEDGRLAIVQGVGYPNPNRSHETSMAIWQSAILGDDDTLRAHGWIGRAIDQMQEDDSASLHHDPQMILLGDENQPLAIQSRKSTAVTLNGLSDLRLKESWEAEHGTTSNALVSFTRQTMNNATVTAQRLETAAGRQFGSTAFPSSRLGQRLESVAKLIKSGFSTPVYYTIQDGYDTHAAQLPSHARLLREFSDAMGAFLDDLTAAGLADRVCVMGFSEFGRRVAENGSSGTDHGTSGPVFIAGHRVHAGLIGNMPSLLDLDEGDLQTNIDFRDVYTEVLTKWMATNADFLERGNRSPLSIFGA